MVARFLVTTSLEETWPAEEVPLLFLGEWCRLYDRRSAWEKRDAIVAPYHWDNREKLHNDYLYLQTLYEESLSNLAVQLNEIHRVDHSVRYWRILVGPWLGYFVQMLFDRWSMVNKVLHEYELEEVLVLDHSDRELIPNDMADFNTLYPYDYWNEFIYGQILELLGVPLHKVHAQCLYSKESLVEVSKGRKQKSFFRQTISGIFRSLSKFRVRDDEVFIFGSYLQKEQELLLQLKLRQIPRLWTEIASPFDATDHRRIAFDLPLKARNEFELLLGKLIPKQIPRLYVEGYGKLVLQAQDCSWPQRPSAIFTSCLHYSDDFFKAWAAEKVERGTKLIIGQHGGNFGVGLWSFAEDHQFLVSDRFLSWGWTSTQTSKITPIGNFKVFGTKKQASDPKGKVLLVEMAIPRYSYHMYSVPVSAIQYLHYFEEQCRFVQALPEELRPQLLVRLYSEDYGLSQSQRWRDRFADVELDSGEAPINKLIAKARVFVATYNATTFLETLTLNIPTIMFWNPFHWEIREDAVIYFEELRSVGIFHDTPEDAARQLSEVWHDVRGWWLSEKLQSARRMFCYTYSRIPDKALDLLAKTCSEIADPKPIGF